MVKMAHGFCWNLPFPRMHGRATGLDKKKMAQNRISTPWNLARKVKLRTTWRMGSEDLEDRENLSMVIIYIQIYIYMSPVRIGLWDPFQLMGLNHGL